MRRTVKATIGIGAATGALALGGSSVLACTNGSSANFTSGTAEPEELGTVSAAEATTQDQSFEFVGENGTPKIVSFDEEKPDAEAAQPADRDDEQEAAEPATTMAAAPAKPAEKPDRDRDSDRAKAESRGDDHGGDRDR